MITITSPVQQEFIIDLLNGKTYDGITFTYAGKGGKLKLNFDTEGQGDAIAAAKRAIKSTSTGSVLYLQYGEVK